MQLSPLAFQGLLFLRFGLRFGLFHGTVGLQPHRAAELAFSQPHDPEQVSLHFSTATTNLSYQEHTGGPEWWNDILPGLADFSGGSATPPEGPGLGVELNEGEAKKHPFVLREMPRWRKADGSVQDW